MPKNRLFSLIKDFFLFLLFLFLILFPILAFGETSITVRPPEINLSLQPGSFISGSFEATNESNSTLDLKISVTDIISLSEGKVQYGILSGDDKSSVASWFSFDNDKITLASKETKKISYKCQVPEGIQAKNYEGVIFIGSANPLEEVSGFSLGIGGRIGVITKVSVLSKTKAKIIDFSAPKVFGKIVDPLNVIFNVLVENVGSTQIQPQGKIEIEDYKGAKIAQLNLKEEKITYGEEKNIETKWDNPPFWGKYKAKLIFNDGSESLPFEKEMEFFIFPWKIILIGFFAIVFLILSFIYFRNKKLSGKGK